MHEGYLRPMLNSRQFLWMQRNVWCPGVRHKSRNAAKSKKTNTDRALENFDDFYRSVYGVRWNRMRLALLSEQKYMAMVNIFGDNESTSQRLESEGAINVKSLVKLALKRQQEASETGEESAKVTQSTESLDNKIKAKAREQESQEIDVLYGSSASTEAMYSSQKPDHLDYIQSDKEREISIDQGKDLKRIPISSMGQAIQNNEICIDESRIVDPELGTGSLNEFVPATSIRTTGDWIPESEHYNYYQTEVDFPLNIQPEEDFKFPEHLALYTYEMGNCSRFPAPRKSITGVLTHYLFDGASILPPLLLGLCEGDRVLDACAAPGGKSLVILQTLLPQQLVCNDVMESRVNRIHKVMQEYLIDYKKQWLSGEEPPLILQQNDARNIYDYESFDKILVDVPCTTDRHSLRQNDNNIFKPTRVKERLRLPELQANILTNCLRLLKPGGSLMYSTCSLSPVQNDGVVHMALQRAFHEWNLHFTIKDLSQTLHLFSDIYNFEYSSGMKYGQMVVPYLTANYGPMYFSKITRN